MDIMVCREHGRIKLVNYATVAFAAALIAMAVACSTEESVPVYRWIDGDSVQVSSRRGITTGLI